MNAKFIALLSSFFFFFTLCSASAQYGKELCADPNFSCIKINKQDTWKAKWPDPRERDLIMRLNRTNLPLARFQWIVVPNNLNALYTLDLSPFPLKIPATGDKFIFVDLNELAFGAYSAQGRLLHWGPVSGGKNFCRDVNKSCKTPVGTYRINTMKGKDAVSSQFPLSTKGGAPMPFCMRFYKGIAFHGSKSLPGYHDSHGCLRLYTEDAQWLNQNFATVGTKVKIIDSSEKLF